MGLLQPRRLFGASQESRVQRYPQALRRPADIYLPRWLRGVPAALDLAVTGGLKGDMVQRSAENCSTVVTTYEDFKRSYLAKRHLPKGGFKLYPSDMRG